MSRRVIQHDEKTSTGNTAGKEKRERHIIMTTTEKRSLFIAPLVDAAAEFIKARGAVTISQLALHLAWAGVNVDGEDELTGEQLAYYRRDTYFAALPVITTGSHEFVLITLALLMNRNVELDFSNPGLVKLIWAVGGMRRPGASCAK
jgi:hypothetical protein